MSHPRIFAEDYDNPDVCTALCEHRADRDALLASLTTSLKSDPRVRAAWLWGSFGRGEADDLSDLDPWLVVSDEAVGDMGQRLLFYAQETGSFITGGESSQNAPPGGGFFSSLHEGRHGLLHLDCYWQPQSAAGDTPAQAALFDRQLEDPAAPTPSPSPRESAALSPEDERIADGLGFAWLMFSIAAKTLARHPDSDMALMIYARSGLEDAAALLGQEDYLAPSDWFVSESPLDKVAVLRRLAGKAAHLTDAASRRGLGLSPLHAVCLTRYLNMVEGILR